MTIPYRQPGIGWCMVYLLANVFKNEKFLRWTEDPEYKACSDEHVEAMLLMRMPEFKMGLVAQSNPAYPPLPIDYVWRVLMMEEAAGELFIEIPIVAYHLTVRLIPSMHHAVAVLKYNNELYYLDPRHDEMFVLDGPEHLAKQFIDCCSIERPYLREDSRWAILIGENLDYTTIETQ
jgi:hypothetical protein